jgi:hypothetical protein
MGVSSGEGSEWGRVWSTGHSMRLTDVVGPKLVYGLTIHASIATVPSSVGVCRPTEGFWKKERQIACFCGSGRGVI